MIKSTSYSNDEIMCNIATLYTNNEIDVDCTYSKGNFYKSGIVPKPKYKFDINPQFEDVVEADSRMLPLCDNSINSIVFDPPFLATKGNINKSSGNIIIKRFGYYANENELHQMYYDSLKEFKRVLKNNGIVIFKCQDKVSSGKQYISHCLIINEAEKLGFITEDIFILLAKSRLVAKWQLNQKHARKYHSYFLVLRKKLIKENTNE